MPRWLAPAVAAVALAALALLAGKVLAPQLLMPKVETTTVALVGPRGKWRSTSANSGQKSATTFNAAGPSGAISTV